MFSKILFYTFLGVATTSMASQQCSKDWFRGIQERKVGKCRNGTIIMMIKCICLQQVTEDLRQDFEFEQNAQGHLFIKHNKNQQLLGCWPNRRIETEYAMTAWYYGENPHVEIQMPYRPITKSPTS